ncbi:MAG TPA: hypothetical protein VGM88_04610 [Kofleriaceae bacterium]|jgi:thiopurine S-methyltransferase
MEPQFWRDTWAAGKTNFHEGRPNELLVRYGERLAGRVLVPLCGKAEDLAHLARAGHAVVGIELVEDAVRAFFAEHGWEPAVSAAGPFARWAAAGIEIFVGDAFAATAAVIGPVDAVYDRAALIALPPELRARYVPLVRELSGESPTLLVTIEYEQPLVAGPPFSVPADEVRARYAGRVVEELEHGATQTPRMREAGVTATQRAWWIS